MSYADKLGIFFSFFSQLKQIIIFYTTLIMIFLFTFRLHKTRYTQANLQGKDSKIFSTWIAFIIFLHDHQDVMVTVFNMIKLLVSDKEKVSYHLRFDIPILLNNMKLT